MAGRTGEPTANPRQVTPHSAANPAEMGSRPTVDFLDPAGGRGRRSPWPRRASRQAELTQPIHCRPWRTLTWIMDTPACVGERHASRHAATPPRADRSGDQGRSCPPGVGQHDELAHDGARRVEPADLRTGPEADDRTLTRERHRLARGSPSRPPGRRPGGVTLGFSDRCPPPDGAGDLRRRALGEKLAIRPPRSGSNGSPPRAGITEQSPRPRPAALNEAPALPSAGLAREGSEARQAGGPPRTMSRIGTRPCSTRARGRCRSGGRADAPTAAWTIRRRMAHSAHRHSSRPAIAHGIRWKRGTIFLRQVGNIFK